MQARETTVDLAALESEKGVFVKPIIERNPQKMIQVSWIGRFLLDFLDDPFNSSPPIALTTVKPLLTSKRWRPSP